jgi:predicted amidohydrolase YtcJ
MIKKPPLFTGVILCLFLSCQGPEPADLILLNGKVWTAEGGDTFVEAVAIRGNRIISTGTSDDLSSLRGTATHAIDLQGKLVVPGFNDAHIHFLGGSTGLLEVDLFDAVTGEEIVKRVVEFANAHPEKTWIKGRGWQYNWFPSGMPTPDDFPGMPTDLPVYLVGYDGHSAWANSKALEMAKVTATSRSPGPGKVVLDKKGSPTGALLEDAQRLVSPFVPKPTREEELGALREGLKLAASLGMTSLQNASGSLRELGLYEELARNNELTARYAAALSVDEHTPQSDIDSFAMKRTEYSTHPFLRVDAIKFMLDGVIESHTGAMIEPYADMPESHGEFAMPLEDYKRLVAQLDKDGFRLYTHAIGNLAIREALNAYEAAAHANGVKPRRHRIEHIENIHPDDIPRFVALGVMPSMEPIHADPGSMGVWERAVGPQRLPFAFAWKSILGTGATLVYSSDWPACIDLNPIRGIHVAVNRRTPAGIPEGGWVVGQSISVAEALKAYTYMGAYSSFEEQAKGQIRAGMLADLAVISDDLFTIDPMKIASAKVVLTVFDGKVVYEAETGN